MGTIRRITTSLILVAGLAVASTPAAGGPLVASPSAEPSQRACVAFVNLFREGAKGQLTMGEVITRTRNARDLARRGTSVPLQQASERMLRATIHHSENGAELSAAVEGVTRACNQLVGAK